MGPTHSLGVIGHVHVGMCQTNAPWAIGADFLVIPMGAGFGTLGRSFADRYPPFWDLVKAVDPQKLAADGARVVQLRTRCDDVRFVVLVSTHDEDGDVTWPAIARATEAGVRAAVRWEALSVAVPLIGSGALGHSKEDAAEITVDVVTRVLGSNPALNSVTLFDRSPITLEIITREWSKVDPDSYYILPADDAPEGGPATPDDLAGGVSTDLVNPREPIPLSRDRLGVAPYVSMLAEVITERNTPLPLSIGVFGKWGAGKSFFMAMLRTRVAELTATRTPEHCERVVQIGFNAWHYADANLWASIADVIFRGLAEPAPDAAAQRSRLQRLLDERRERRSELTALTDHVQEQIARLHERIDRAAADHRVRTRDLLTVMARSEEVGKRLAKVWQHVGVKNQDERGALLSEELRAIRTDAEVLRVFPAERNGKVALAAAVVLLALTGLVVLVVPAAVWPGAALAAAAAGWGVRSVSAARRGLGELRAMTKDIRDGLVDVRDRDVHQQLRAEFDELRDIEAREVVVRAQLDEVVHEAGELGRDLAALDPAHRMSTFVTDRATGKSYTRNLGVISTLRKDFEQLVELLDDCRKHPETAAGTPPIDRIVLYIDDLDRCAPHQVVSVLEAVHLLLAMDLFVVVVGVDPRWLVESLRSHYSEILTTPGPRPTPWQVTPEDYLEKIINIPLTLPGMTGGSLGSILRSLAEVEAAPVAALVAAAGDTSVSVPEIDFPVEPGAALNPTNRAAQRRPLTEREVELLELLDPLIATPRAAKRLFNIYRMIRATRDLSDASVFLGSDDRPGEFEAVIVLLGVVSAAPSLAPSVFAGLLAAPELGADWATFVHDLGSRSAELNQLHAGLVPVTGRVTLPNLTAFRTWAPRIQRFTYTDVE